MAKGTLWHKIETERSAKSPSTKSTKHLCKSTCYATVPKLELTSSRILSLLSPNSHAIITGTVKLRMLRKQNNSTHNLCQDVILKSLDRIACMEGFFNCTELSIAQRGKRHFIRSLPVSILLRELTLPC